MRKERQRAIRRKEKAKLIARARAEAQSHGIELSVDDHLQNEDALSEEESDHEKSDEDELAVARKLETQLNMLAEDPDLLYDLKKLKRTTKNV